MSNDGTVSHKDGDGAVTDFGPLRPADVKLASLANLRFQAETVGSTPVLGSRGESMTVEAAQEWAHALAVDIAVAEGGGSRRHRTVPRVGRVLGVALVAVVDFPMMLWIVASVFNVDWAEPWGIPLLVSLVVSALATGGAAFSLHALGYGLREHKTDDRGLHPRELPAGPILACVLAALLITGVATVMFARVYLEGLASGLSGMAVLLAALVSLVVLVSALLVVWTSFWDGSPERDDLAHYSAIVAVHLERKRALLQQAFHLAHQYEILERGRRADAPGPRNGAE